MTPTQSQQPGGAIRIVLLLAVLFAVAGEVTAERLPVKTYGTTDGLVHNRITRVTKDSHGFLWFCAVGGLSRFDGYRFFNYTVDDGMPAPSINDLLETSDGVYWVATNSDGIFRLNLLAGASRFTPYKVSDQPATNRVNALYKDHAGRLWAGTDGGLFYLDETKGESEFRPAPLGIPSHTDIQVQVWALVEDRPGSLWIGTKFGLVHRLPDGRMVHYAIQPSESSDTILALLIDRQKRLWLGHQSGLIVFNPEMASQSEGAAVLPAQARRYTTSGADVQGLCETSDGRIWAAVFGGNLLEFDGSAFRTYTIPERFGDRNSTLVEDRDGNLWVSTESNGALKITRQGLVNYGQEEGLGQAISSVFENKGGELYAYSSVWRISRFDGGRFITLKPNLPAAVTDLSWRERSGLIQDHTGEWWVATREGLCRFPKVGRFELLAQARPKVVYTTRDGLAHNDVTRLFEDSRGDIWVASFVPTREVVTRWERRTATFNRYSEADGLRPFTSVVAFCEDGAGDVWMGFREGGLARYRAGRFTLLGANEGFPAGSVNNIYLDQSGRLWVGVSQGGLCRIDNPGSDRPQVITYTKAQGLTSNIAHQVTGDLEGRIYVSSNLGIDRLDPATGHVKHYSIADGLTGGEFNTAFRDRSGALWFGTTKGLSRLTPQPDASLSPPPVFINGLRISGESLPISELGERAVTELEMETGRNNIQIDFFAFAFGVGEALRYQYKLEGSNVDWSLPSDQRTVNYANLAPGAYRFLVRGVSADGMISQSPATVSFKILPPFWQRWWFITLAVLLVASAVFAFDRYRVARLKELDAALTESQKLTEQLTDQRAELKRANQSLALEAAVTAIISESTTLNDAAPKILQAVCELAEWESGKLWELDPQTKAPRRIAVYRKQIDDNGDNRSSLQTASPEADSTRAFGFPILLGHEVLGILELFSRTTRERDAERFEMMTTIGSHIGQLIERKRADEALRKSKEERLAELERVRRRIATDLHDDIGSSLTQIAILSEVAYQHAGRGDKHGQEPLSRVITVSNELVDAMSDIVWAINPKKDHLSDLLQRMRRFASDIFTARGVAFRFTTSDIKDEIQLGANIRREVYLIFKESINNIAKHSQCSEAVSEVCVTDGWLTLKISDNGNGFDAAMVKADTGYLSSQSRGGNGLASMRKRASELAGGFEITSAPGKGTAILLRVPITQQASANQMNVTS